MKIELISESLAFTKNLGSLFTIIFNSGDTILLSGELGAGKTTFISGIAEGFGLKENLSSPSFTILIIYRIDGKRKLVHADFYRLNTISEILNVGIEDYLYDRNFFICIEWGDLIREYLRINYLEIRFNYCLENNRIGINNRTGLGNNLKGLSNSIAEININQKRQIIFESENRYWDKKLEVFNSLLLKIK